MQKKWIWAPVIDCCGYPQVLTGSGRMTHYPTHHMTWMLTPSQKWRAAILFFVIRSYKFLCHRKPRQNGESWVEFHRPSICRVILLYAFRCQMMRDYVAYTAATFRFSREIPVILIDLCNDIYIFDYLDLNRTGSTHLSSLQLLRYACLALVTVVFLCETYKKTGVSVILS